MILLTETVFAPALAYLVFAELPPMASFIGGAVIQATVLGYVVVTARK